jgi:hypothetical protein
MKAGTSISDYRLFGLRLRSAIALPELEPVLCDDADAVQIRLGRVPRTTDGAATHWLAQTTSGAVLTVAGVGRFCIRDGAEIIVDPDPAASARNVRLYLLGSAMGALLHQRHMLPLHANAVVLDAGAVAFLGASGAGKSTLAAAFHDRSRHVLSDDVCVVTEAGQGVLAEPGVPRVRLWRDAVERSGRTIDAYERAFDSLDKYTVGLDQARNSGAVRLRAVYLLTRIDDGDGTAIRRLEGVEAIKALMENTYRGGFIPFVGDSRSHFEKCVRISQHVPIFCLVRPWDSARIGETILKVEEHLGAMASTGL